MITVDSQINEIPVGHKMLPLFGFMLKFWLPLFGEF